MVGLRGSKNRRKQIVQDKVCHVLLRYMDELSSTSDSSSSTDLEIVNTCVEYCVNLESTELLFGKLWDLVSETDALKRTYLRSLETPLLEGSLPPQLPPFIVQQLVALYDQEDRLDSLQAIVIILNVDCLDIHQVILKFCMFLTFNCFRKKSRSLKNCLFYTLKSLLEFNFFALKT